MGQQDQLETQNCIEHTAAANLVAFDVTRRCEDSTVLWHAQLLVVVYESVTILD
eukprot:COSAG06_NODE_5846_length_3248_cov_1.339155_6_plen_53_part_01